MAQLNVELRIFPRSFRVTASRSHIPIDALARAPEAPGAVSPRHSSAGVWLSLAFRLIDQECCSRLEEASQDLLSLVRKHRFFQCLVHQLEPSVARNSPDCERGVTHAQHGMTTLFDIGSWPTESKNEKISKTLFGSLQIMRRINRPQNVIARNLPVESRNQALKSLMADDRINLSLFH